MISLLLHRSCRAGSILGMIFYLASGLMTWGLLELPARAAERPIHYLLDLREPASHVVQVTMTVADAQPGIELAFPAWNNLYQIRDFVRNVQDLEARCDGSPEVLARVDLNTWRSQTRACSSLELRYGVYADDESVFSAVLNDQHAFLNFALLLFYLPRQRERSIRVEFLLPSGWKLATVLDQDGEEFSAAGYDRLVDSPAEAGLFQEYDYTQSGATYRVVVHADPGDYSAERLLASLQKITAMETALMQEVPFRRYTFFLHFLRPGRSGGMEHRGGTAISMSAADLREHWDWLESALAHEFFHLWNVKRIRPQGLEPIDYEHGNDTSELWFSEGVTSCYQDLVLLRAGLINRKTFYERIAAEVQALQAHPARLHQSAAQSGFEAWFEKYPDYFRAERSISYYNKGALLGFLLDLGIRHATENHHSLDGVMRRLNEEYALQGRYFTMADLRALIRELAPEFSGEESFFRNYVTGTSELDYETYLGYAGLRPEQETQERPSLGFPAVQSFDGPIRVESVEPGSNAQKAGIEQGDILLSMDGKPLTALPLSLLTKMKPGQKVAFQIRRGGRVIEIDYALDRKSVPVYRVQEITHASRDQVRIREGWLSGREEGQ